MKKTLYIMAAVMLLTACEEKVIDIDPSQSAPRVVVMSALEADTTMSVHLTYSRFFLDNRPFTEITDADVQFSVDGSAVAVPVTRSDGYYSVAHTVSAGETLGLRVTVPGHGTYTASTVVPDNPVVTSATAKRINNEGEYSLRFSLADRKGQDNYYSVRLNYVYDTLFYPEYDSLGNLTYDTTVGAFSGSAYLTCNDYLLVDQSSSLSGVLDDDGAGGTELYFTDMSIDGRTYEVRVTASLGSGSVYYDDQAASTLTSTPRFELEVASYSRDRYLYDITTSQYSDDGMLGMFEEPVQVHCNIDGGGIGIFAARNRKTFPVANE